MFYIRKMYRFVMTVLMIVGSSVTFAGSSSLPLVAVTQIVEHAALTEIYKGMIDGLKDAGYEQGKTIDIDYKVAQGDMALNTQIAKQFVGENPAVIVAITTSSAQAAVSAARGKVPILFSGITDPIGARLVDNLEKPGKNVSGVRETLAYGEMAALIAELFPNLKTIGAVYNPSEDNSNTSVREFRKLAIERGWTFITAPAKNSGEVLEAARSLEGRVDAIIAVMDNTATSAFPAIVQVANQNKIPLLTLDTFNVDQGAAIGVGYDEYDVGRLTADMIVKVLNGHDPSDLPVVTVTKPRIAINRSAVKMQGITLPQSLIDKATVIIDH